MHQFERDSIKFCKEKNLVKTISRTSGKFLEALINGENLFDLISMDPYSAKARIVALEGINCCGKTTQIKLLKQNLKKMV